MKISKTAVLALGGVFMTAGLGLMFVSATEKYLELDLNNAVQHFERVRFISSGSNNSVVDMMRVGEEDGPLINIVANNFAITQTGSTGKNIIIDGGSYSSILGGMANSLKGNYSVILGGEKNTISNGDYYDVILGGVGNSVNGAASVILGGTGNKISNGLSSIVGGSDNEITASNSVAVGKNIRILRSSSNGNNVVMGSNMTITGDNIFLWSDSALSFSGKNIFAVKGANGMIVNTGMAHSFAKLTIGGSLVVRDRNQNLTCDASLKGVLRLKTQDGKKCFCSCDGEGWHSVVGGGLCMGICDDSSSKARCNYDANLQITCNEANGTTGKMAYRIDNGCDKGKMLKGTGAYLIDEYNYIHWTCMEDNGDSTGCVSPFEAPACDVAVPALGCSATTTGYGDCTFNLPAAEHDDIVNGELQTTGHVGSLTAKCNDGKFERISGSCTAVSCSNTLVVDPNGGRVTLSGQVITESRQEIRVCGSTVPLSTSPGKQTEGCIVTLSGNASGDIHLSFLEMNLTLPVTTTYPFSGWVNSPDCGTWSSSVYTFPSGQSNNGKTCTKKAIWKPTGTTSAPSTGITLLGITRSGYDFKGWYTAPVSGTKVGYSGSTYTGACGVLYAHWDIGSSDCFDYTEYLSCSNGTTGTAVTSTDPTLLKWKCGTKTCKTCNKNSGYNYKILDGNPVCVKCNNCAKNGFPYCFPIVFGVDCKEDGMEIINN